MSDNVTKYSGRTQFYFLPVFRPDNGDGGSVPRVSARGEQRRVNICDNLLYGGNRVNLGKIYQTCVLNEGTWTISGSSVTLSSFEGYIQGVYIANRGNPVSWTAVPSGATQDLFVGIVETQQDSPAQVFVSSREYGDIITKIVPSSQNYSNSNFMLMAKVDM
jgi:hypothetical protein